MDHRNLINYRIFKIIFLVSVLLRKIKNPWHIISNIYLSGIRIYQVEISVSSSLEEKLNLLWTCGAGIVV